MPRFHINNSGDAGACRAETGPCPFGGEAAHFPTLDSAREAYEASMAPVAFGASSMKPTNKEMFISILTSNQDVLTERFGDNLNDLEPGDYIAQYYDTKTAKERFIKLRIGADLSVGYEDVAKFQRLTPVTSPKTLAAFKEADDAYRDLNADPVHCTKNKIDRITLMESSKGFERVLAKYDITKAEDSTLARQELEDLEWVLDHDLALAERDGKEAEFNAITAAKEPLANFLNSLRR